MLIFTHHNDFSITDPQLIKHLKSGMIFPAIQFIATTSYQYLTWYPVILGFYGKKVIFKRTYRGFRDKKDAFDYALIELKRTFQGIRTGRKTQHWMLNSWANDIKLVLDKVLVL